MSGLGKWRIGEMPDQDNDLPDRGEPADILFKAQSPGEAHFLARRSTSSTAC